MRVVVTRSFGSYRKGQEFDWQPSFAKILIARGLIEPLEMAEIETADVEQRTETATLKPRRGRKKKPA